MINVAIIGAGEIVKTFHLPAWKKIKGIKIVGIVDKKVNKAKLLAKNYKIPKAYHNIDSLFKNEKVDAVDVCTPNKQHEKDILFSLKNNKHVICEKPFVLNFKVFKKINIEQFKNFLGEHNYQNIAAVYAIILSLGFLDWKKIENSIKSFKILPHRLQKIRKVCDITFINDSKATNIDAADQALKNFNNIYWILGGRIKEKNLQKLKKHFFRIKHVFLVGETKFLYEKYLRNFLECTIVKNLAEAVKLSYFLAKEKIKKEKVKPSIIFLSPACS